MPSAPSIGFDIRPSRALAVAAALVLACGLVAVLLSGIAPWVQSLLCLASAGAGAYALRAYARPRYARADLREGTWSLADAQGRAHAATLRGHRRLGSCVQVEFDVDGARFTHLLTPDNSDADTRRRLLLVLAHGSAPVTGQSLT